ncbi:tRNA (adenosine(37)-N6)-threonylcarbamoyltransferase complex dimerization subunit type 1 TsaB [Erythrobacter sp. LQ02-29]|uniref:tRNA (adenosine(37)-N6)-threonylcarbamoyltransferase complex dimerization subunit type 1 TsaB n=1 Tax=Erythrobacter sp. LQ02-29 TaxID=2920384 RepID=UPI001F4E9EFE|nr:tRNA (adenosine(37)-N6)-threonylcarbamoyltransferase complex dimerization subunit type 1 TsaB [Erythrobacter sp. LQ02-29]MCP9222803.1 tRNA (adenosine(37)-N6)-threonylcarbamoyltransferase complex dimerization subunit type 1 TsaB [Erythrobacter sp. LQ02-29]
MESPRTLVIECATEACSIALVEGERVVAHDHRVLGRGHAEQLVPMIAALPERGKAARIAISLGPGSFTGVRIGVATGRALGVAWGAHVVGFPTLALVAAMVRREHGNQPVGVAMTGGHGEWFVQEFDTGGLPATDLLSLPPEAAARELRPPLVAGSQAEPLVAARGQGSALSLLPDASAFPALPTMLLTDRVAPIYGRAPDARPAAPRP